MKKKWYKRIFAGILALALTATSFSGDIENLVRAEEPTIDLADYDQMTSGYVLDEYISGTNYTQIKSIEFELYNATEGDISVSGTISAQFNPSIAESDRITVSAPVAQTIAGNSTWKCTFDDASSLRAISLANAERAIIKLDLGDIPSGLYIKRQGGADKYFKIGLDSGSDTGAYAVSIGDTTEVTLLSTSTEGLTATPVINNINYQNREINVDVSGDVVSVTSNGDGSYKIMPASSTANGTAYIDFKAPNTSATVRLTVNVVSATMDYDTFTYNGNQQTPTVTIGGVARDVTWNQATRVNFGTYTGTVVVSGNTMNVSYSIVPLDLSSATIVTQSDFKINNATSEVSGTITVDGKLVNVNGRDGVAATATYLRTDGSNRVYRVTFVGSGNYTGSPYTEINSPIGGGNKTDIAPLLDVEVNDESCKYTGSEVYPELNVKYNGTLIYTGTPISNNVACTYGGKTIAYINFSNNVNAGEPQFEIRGNEEEGYTGALQGDFLIRKVDISECKITYVDTPGFEVYYDHGNPVTLGTITVTKGGTTFSEEKGDYVVRYVNNKDIGKAYVYIEPRDINLTGMDIRQAFSIKGKLSDARVAVGSGITYTDSYSTNYTGSAIEPKVKLYFGSTRIDSSLYEIKEYQNNKNAGTAKIIISGKGEFAGQEIEKEFTINPIALPNKVEIRLGAAKIYNGKAQPLTDADTLSVIGVIDDVDHEAENFEIVGYNNNINATTSSSKAEVIVKGKKNYTGEVKGYYDIEKLDISSDARVTLTLEPTSMTYTGSELHPTAIIALSGEQLPAGDFKTPTYKNAIQVGTNTASVTLEGTGKNIIGKKTANFSITVRDLKDCDVFIEGSKAEKTGEGVYVCSGYNPFYLGQIVSPSIQIKEKSGLTVSKDNYKIPVSSMRATHVFRTGDDPDQTTKSQHPTADLVSNKNYITVNGQGPYAGSSIKIYFTIKPREIGSDGITFTLDESKLASPSASDLATISTWLISGAKDTHPGKVSLAEDLTVNKDYQVIIPSGGTQAGTHEATIKGIGDYTGETKIEYTIGASLDKNTKVEIRLYPNSASIEAEKYGVKDGVIQTEYLGDGQFPALRVFFDGNEIPSDNYTVDFKNKTEFDADGRLRDVTVTAKPGSSLLYGEKTVQYVINKVDLAKLQTQGLLALEHTGATISGTTVSLVYDGKNHQASDFKLYRLATKGGSHVGPALDGTIVRYNPKDFPDGAKDVGEYHLDIEANSVNYEGKISYTIKITQKELVDDAGKYTITVTPSTATYTGSEIKPVVKIVDKGTGKELTADDFSVEYRDNIDASTAAVKGKCVITGKGNYKGGFTKEFEITKISVNDFEVIFTNNGRYEYTGSPITPSYTVLYNGKVLREGVDFTTNILPVDHTNPTKAELQIVAMPDTEYTGTSSSGKFPFTIYGNLNDLKESGKITVNDSALPDSITIKPGYTVDDILTKTDLKLLKSSIIKYEPTSSALVYGEDYVISDLDVSLGTHEIKIQGLPDGRFSGNITIKNVQFRGLFEDTVLKDTQPEETYTGSDINHKSKIKLTWNNQTVPTSKYQYDVDGGVDGTKGKDGGSYSYTVRPAAGSDDLWANSGADTGTALVSKDGTWSIVYNLSKMSLTLKVPPVSEDVDASGKKYYYLEYNGADRTSDIKSAIKLTITDPVTHLEKDVNIDETNYKVAFNKTPKNPGDYTLTLTKADGTSSFTTGSVSGAIKIIGKQLVSCDVKGFEGTSITGNEIEYTGDKVTPTVQVKDGEGVVDPSCYDLIYYDQDGHRVASCINANKTDDEFYYVVAQGKDGYAGETPMSEGSKFRITQFDLEKDGVFTSNTAAGEGHVSAVADENVYYTGEAVEPDVTVNYHTSSTGRKKLVEGTDYQIKYFKNVNVSSLSDTPINPNYAYYEIKGIGNYKGTVYKNFVIKQAEIKNITLAKNTSPYTGSAIDFTNSSILKVQDENGKDLVYGKDYTVSPTTGTEKKTYDLEITGIGNYTGKTKFDKEGKPLTFTITARRIEDDYVEVKIAGSNTVATSTDPENDPYAITDYICATFPETAPAITVRDTTLNKDVPFEILGWHNTDKSGDGSLHDPAKSPYVEIKAKDGSQYEGTKKVYFSIGKDLRNGTITWKSGKPDLTFTGKAQPDNLERLIEVKDETGRKLTYRTDYDINYPSDMINAGQNKKVSVVGKGQYFGTLKYEDGKAASKVEFVYDINPRDVADHESDFTVTLALEKDGNDDYYTYWTGEDIEPKVTVKDSGILRPSGYTLKEGVDYTVIYSNQKEISTDGLWAAATIIPMGNFKDSRAQNLSVEYRILPIEMKDGNIDIQWTGFTPAGNNVVDWDGYLTQVVPDYRVVYKPKSGGVIELEEGLGKDYTVAFGYYDNNGDYIRSDDPSADFRWYAGPMDLIVKGSGNYAGEESKTYTICADLGDITDEDILGGTDAFFTGTIPVLDNLLIKFASESELILPTNLDEVSSTSQKVVWENDNFRMEFTCPYGDYDEGQLKLLSVGPYYTGTFVYDFYADSDLSKINVVDYENSFPYTGAPVDFTYRLKIGETYLSNDISTVTYLDADKNVIPAPIERGNYYAQITLTVGDDEEVKDPIPFEILGGDIDKAIVTYTDTWTYNKTQIKPPVKVEDLSGKMLKENVDYKVTYGENNTPTSYPTLPEDRTGVITITGLGNYAGSQKVVKFAINPPSPGSKEDGGVFVSAETDDSVRLNWVRNPAVSKWVIKYTDNPGVVDPITVEAGNVDNYRVISGLINDCEYEFEIYSVVELVYGGTTIEVEGPSVTVNGETRPRTISAVTLSSPGPTQVNVTWPTVTGITGYEVARSDNKDNNYHLILSVPASRNITNYVCSGLNSGRTYWFVARTYRVDSNRVVHYGGWSEPVQITVP